MSRMMTALTTVAAAVVVLAVESLAATPPGSERRTPGQELTALISAVRAETDQTKQELIARKMPPLADEADLGTVDAKALEDLGSLLDTSGATTQRWVAATLGLFERRAMFALPKLRALYEEAQCARLRGESENYMADVFRSAIQSIVGVADAAVRLSDKDTEPRRCMTYACCRLTLRCSGPGWHKVLGRGRSAFSNNQPRLARVLERPWPAAELGS